jgi:ribonuclease-3
MILLEREKMLSELEQKIGYSFRSRALLDRALTHRSFANERLGENCQHNEAMEFLGDSVLGFVVSAWLLERFPDLSEGKLSKMKAHLVSESRLVELAETLDLGSYILLNRGEEKTGGRQKHALLADAYEALIGVLYVDGGIAVAEKFLRRELREKLSCIDPSSMIGADYKSALQEKLQSVGGPSPDYVVVEVLGPDHRRTFRVELRIGRSALSMGEGRTIKLAQQEAARVALESSDDLVTIAAEQRRIGASSESRGDRRVAVDVTADQEPLSRLAPEQNAEVLTSARSEIAAHSKEAGEDFNRDASLDISPEAETDREARSVTSDV